MKKVLSSFIILVFLASSAVAFMPAERAEAATGWTYLTHSSSEWARACKNWQSGGDYGPVYHVTYQFYRKNTSISAIELTITRGSQLVNHEYQPNWLYGSIAGTSDYASAYHSDRVTFGVYHSNGNYSNAGAGGQLVSGLANCSW